MSYIGNQVTSVPFTADVFSGNGSAKSFGPMIRIPATIASIAVFVDGSYKTPGIDYTLDVDYIVFTTPPAGGTNNIVAHHLGNGIMATQVPADGSVTGAKLAVNIINANNIVDGSITSNVLASNLQISVSRVAETINTVTSGITGNYNIHIANSSVYYFTANTTGNVTFNLRANTQNTLDSIVSTGQTASVTIFLKQGENRYRANVYIDDVLQTAYWLGNSQPSYLTSQSESFDVYKFNVLKTAANSYTVFAANSLFATAIGQE